MRRIVLVLALALPGCTHLSRAEWASFPGGASQYDVAQGVRLRSGGLTLDLLAGTRHFLESGRDEPLGQVGAGVTVLGRLHVRGRVDLAHPDDVTAMVCAEVEW